MIVDNSYRCRGRGKSRRFVKIAGRWAFQYTALDDCTRFRVLRLYRRLHQRFSLTFLGELCRGSPRSRNTR